MGILISCCNSTGGIFVLDENVLEIKRISGTETRGMAIYDNLLYTCNREGLLIYDTGNNFELINSLKTTEKEWHGLQIYNDEVHVCCTGVDTIFVFSLNLEHLYSVKLRATNIGRHHINDFFIENEHIYCSMFSDVQKTAYASGNGCIKHYHNVTKILYEGLNQPHSIIKHEENLYFCNSAEGEVRQGENCILKSDGYLRGLLITNKYYFVGVSKDRKNKSNNQCYIIRQNKITGKRDIIPVPASEIYSIIEKQT